MNVHSATLSGKIENFFQMLNFLLQFHNKGIILRRHSISFNLDHDLLGSIGELQGWDGLCCMVLQTIDSGDQSCFSVTT